MDKKLLTQDSINAIDQDILGHAAEERNQLVELAKRRFALFIVVVKIFFAH